MTNLETEEHLAYLRRRGAFIDQALKEHCAADDPMARQLFQQIEAWQRDNPAPNKAPPK